MWHQGPHGQPCCGVQLATMRKWVVLLPAARALVGGVPPEVEGFPGAPCACALLSPAPFRLALPSRLWTPLGWLSLVGGW